MLKRLLFWPKSKKTMYKELKISLTYNTYTKDNIENIIIFTIYKCIKITQPLIRDRSKKKSTLNRKNEWLTILLVYKIFYLQNKKYVSRS